MVLSGSGDGSTARGGGGFLEAEEKRDRKAPDIGVVAHSFLGQWNPLAIATLRYEDAP